MRNLTVPAVLIAVAVAGCASEPAPDEQPPSEVAPQQERRAADAEHGAPANSITSVEDLVGEYRVAGIDGEPLDAPIGIALSIDEPLMSYEPTCAGFVWSIAFEGKTSRTTRNRGANDAAPGSPKPVCAVAIHPVQRKLANALDAATQAKRDPSNAILLSGGGHRVTLYSQ